MSNPVPVILIVEDDENDRAMLQRGFGRVNIKGEIRFLADGEKAIAYMAGTGEFSDRESFPLPVLMLLDLRLPRKSGFEVLEWLRGREGIRRLPVVVLTSSRDPRDIDRAYDLGANSYLSKPPTPQSLEEMLRNVNLYWLLQNESPRLAGD
jgi:CheY-like chemotaxis protein